MRIIGIDPGQSGGIAIRSENGVVAWPFTDKTEKDILELIRGVNNSNMPEVCYMEAVHSMPGQGVASMFKFGKGYGFLRACVMSCNIPLVDVSPMKWQSALGCRTKGDKNITKARAQQMFPKMPVTHAIADAILIAHYGYGIESARGAMFT